MADPLGAVLEHRQAMLVEGERSAGCGVAPAEAPATLEVDGRERGLIVALPERYEPEVPHALVIAFHGRTSPAAKVRRYYDLERHATRPTIFVYPSGLAGDDGRLTWSEPGDPPGDLRDHRLFDAVVRLVNEVYCLDRGRIFAVGHSLGAWFANSLACARGDVLRAVGTLGGSISAGACRGEVAAILLHNPYDRLVPVAQGLAVRDHLLEQNRLRLGGYGIDHAGFRCTRYAFRGTLHPVLWCAHNRDRTPGGGYYPHQWPKGAGAAIMRFFEALPPG